MVIARTVNLSHLASQCSNSALVSSNYRRLQGFFQHVRLEGDWLALAVVKLLNLSPPFVVCLDRTNWKIGRHDVNILMLAIALWLVKTSSTNQHPILCVPVRQRHSTEDPRVRAADEDLTRDSRRSVETI